MWSAGTAGGLTWQDFYSVHVHARPTYRFAPTSFFHGRTIDKRISVAWGSWDIVRAHAACVTSIWHYTMPSCMQASISTARLYMPAPCRSQVVCLACSSPC